MRFGFLRGIHSLDHGGGVASESRLIEVFGLDRRRSGQALKSGMRVHLGDESI
jgi:hypothetical protein